MEQSEVRRQASVGAVVRHVPPVVLLVEPNSGIWSALRRRLEAVATVITCATFGQARRALLVEPYQEVLMTNLRLREYNGLHLVLLAAATKQTRSVVYDTAGDLGLAREAQRLGAFYEYGTRIADALPAYACATLPAWDRRDATLRDRRSLSRGGRRASDRRPPAPA